MSEPLREQVMTAVVTTIRDALAASQAWGNFPAHEVERKALVLTQLGNRLRILVLDDDGSNTPTPESHDPPTVDDRFNFLVVVQVNDPDTPSRWGQRALDAIKRGLRDAPVDGALATLTKELVDFGDEGVYLPTDQLGRFGEWILPCTIKIPDNLGGFWPDDE